MIGRGSVEEAAIWIGLFIAIVSWVLLLETSDLQPVSARCDPGEFVEGVRPTGDTWCVRSPTRETDCRGARACHAAEEPVYTRPLKIYCTGGAVPIVVDERTIGCHKVNR